MKRIVLLFVTAVMVLSSCNLPMIAPEASPTPPATATLAATPTLAPTDTQAPTPTQALPTIPPTPEGGPQFTLAPTATQPSGQPPAAPGQPTLAPIATQPAPTVVPPTQGVAIPPSRALFEGSFTGGVLSFRVGEQRSRVIPKTVVLKGATCKDGRNINDSISFEPPPSFVIDQGKFTISVDDRVTISGQFLASNRAAGMITLHLRKGGKSCVVGPLSWAATTTGAQ